jgi:hypothetical protein
MIPTCSFTITLLIVISVGGNRRIVVVNIP